MDAYVIENQIYNDLFPESNFKIIIELGVDYECIDDDLDNYHDVHNEDQTIYTAPNGYKYFAINGLTVTFYRPIVNSFNYHIVICEIEQEELERRNITYDELMSLNPIFTFKL